jgi:hypothetical protein
MMLNSPAQQERSKIELSLAAGEEGLADRLEAFCELLVERGIAPSLPYVLRGSKLAAVRKRADYFGDELRRKTARVFVSSSASRRVTADSTFIEGLTDVWSGMTFSVRVEYPSWPWPDQERVLAAAGDALRALSGFVTPEASTIQLMAHSAIGMHASPADRATVELKAHGLLEALQQGGVVLPSIKPIFLGGVLRHRAQPQTLGWLNYWSAETCEFLGFPDPVRHADLLRHSQRTAAGAWLVKITEEPLDVTRVDHVTMLASVYQRLPNLGIRIRDAADAGGASMQPSRMARAFVEAADPLAVARTLEVLLESSGIVISVGQPPRSPAPGLTVKHGAQGWTEIVAQPAEFLAEHRIGDRPLLGALCRTLRTSGFLLSVHSRVDAVLMESDFSGVCRVSGGLSGSDYTARQFHGLPIEAPLIQFRALPVELDMLDVDDYFQLLEAVTAEFAASAA